MTARMRSARGAPRGASRNARRGGSRRAREKTRNFHHQNGTTRKAGVGGAVSPLHAAPVRSHQTTARRAGVSTRIARACHLLASLRVERDPPPRARRPVARALAARAQIARARSARADGPRSITCRFPLRAGDLIGAESAGSSSAPPPCRPRRLSVRREQGRCGGASSTVVGKTLAFVLPLDGGSSPRAEAPFPNTLRGCDRRLAPRGSWRSRYTTSSCRGRAPSRRRPAAKAKAKARANAAGRRNGRRRRRQKFAERGGRGSESTLSCWTTSWSARK